MSQDQKPIEKLYSNPKSRSFVNHLIGAYLPIDKIEKAWQFREAGDHKCNVCSAKLIDVETVMKRMNDPEYINHFMDDIKKQISGEPIEKEDSAMQKYVSKGAILGFTGKNTNTYLCNDCIQDLLNMVQTGLLMGDKNIQWIVNKMRRDEVFSTFKESPALSDSEKADVSRIQKNVEKSPTKKITTFGDLQALQDLKAKMDSKKD